jgi:hypothetical protein
MEDAVRWFLHLFGKQAAGISWPGFDSSFFRQGRLTSLGLELSRKQIDRESG